MTCTTQIITYPGRTGLPKQDTEFICDGFWHRFKLKDDNGIVYDFVERCKYANNTEIEKKINKFNLGNKEFTNFKQDGLVNQYNAVKGFMDSDKTKLYMFGDSYLGKTHLAISLFKQVMRRNISAYFVDSFVLQSIFQEKVNGDNDQYNMLIGSKWIFIDDIGKEHQSGSTFFESNLLALLNQRDHEDRRFVITSNMLPKTGPGGLPYCQPTINRLIDNAVMVPFPGQKYKN
jgi:DNA replication protein DnaC